MVCFTFIRLSCGLEELAVFHLVNKGLCARFLIQLVLYLVVLKDLVGGRLEIIGEWLQRTL